MHSDDWFAKFNAHQSSRYTVNITVYVHNIVVVEKFERIEFPKPQVPEIKQEIAPYNGFGSVEDSMASCLNLIPKAPRRYIHSEPFIEMLEFF